MQGIERAYLAAAIRAVSEANRNLLRLSCREAVQHIPGYGKEDTLIADSVPEIALRKALVESFDHQLILVAEELGRSADLVDVGSRVVCFADPLDVQRCWEHSYDDTPPIRS